MIIRCIDVQEQRTRQHTTTAGNKKEKHLMQRKALLLAATAGLIPIGGAQAADIEIYGQAHLAASHLDDGDDYSAVNLSSNSSRIGFRAGHDLDDTLRAIVQLEGQVNLDNTDTDVLTSRNSFAGLTGDWGTARAGRFDTPNKVLRSRVDLFGNQVGDARNVIRGNYIIDPNADDSGTHQGFDERFRKGLAYTTPQLNGFFADIHYSVETQANSRSADGNDNDAWSASITYREGPLYAAIAHEQWNFEDADAERDVTRVAAYFDIARFRLTGLAQTASDPDDNAYGAGVRYTLTPAVHLKTQYYLLDADDGDFDADLIAVGVDYAYTDNASFYLNYAQIDNDDLQTRQPWNAASSIDLTGASGHTGSAVAAGMVYKF